MTISWNIKSEQQELPCASVWAPLEARVRAVRAVTDFVPSATQQTGALHSVLASVIRQLGQFAGDTGGGLI